MFVNYVSKIKRVLNEKSCYGVGVPMCYSLNCYQHFLRQIMGLSLDKNSRTSHLRRELPTCLTFQEGYIEEKIAIVQNL